MAFDLYAGSPKSKRERLELLKGSLFTIRSSFDAHWRDLADFVQPRRIRFFASDRNRGDKRNQNIIDSSARFAHRTLQSGLHAGLTSPARPWFKLTTPDPDLADFEPVKEWLHLFTQRMITVFIQSNLYQSLPTVYGDFGLFGTAAMAAVEDGKDLFRTYAYPIGSFAIGLDERNVVDTFVREYELTVKQIVRRYGVRSPGSTSIDWSNISTSVKNLWDRGDYEQSIPVTWMVKPNEDADADRFESRFLPFLSCTWESNEQSSAGERRFLDESGFKRNPIMAPRWEVTGEDSYGTDCPGMTALGDVRQLQSMQRFKGKGIVKQVDPPVTGPSALRSVKVSTLPNDITYVDVRDGMQGFRPVYQPNINLRDLSEDLAATTYRIQRAFYEDLFLMIARTDQLSRSGQPVTAREIEERHEEKLLALGPVLERTNDELLEPLIDRVAQMMFDNKLVPDAPPELQGVNLKVEFISIMAQAQKLVGVIGQDRFLQTMVPLIEAGIVSRHKIKGNQIVDNYRDMLGVDPRAVRTDEEADALQAAEAQQQQATQNAETAQRYAQAAATAGKAPIAPESPLDKVLTGITGGVAA
jgi:Bacteriophage head to tail connecting protein